MNHIKYIQIFFLFVFIIFSGVDAKVEAGENAIPPGWNINIPNNSWGGSSPPEEIETAWWSFLEKEITFDENTPIHGMPEDWEDLDISTLEPKDDWYLWDLCRVEITADGLTCTSESIPYECRLWELDELCEFKQDHQPDAKTYTLKAKILKTSPSIPLANNTSTLDIEIYFQSFIWHTPTPLIQTIDWNPDHRPDIYHMEPFSDFTDISTDNEYLHLVHGSTVSSFSTDRINPTDGNKALSFSYTLGWEYYNMLQVQIKSTAPIDETIGKIVFYYGTKKIEVDEIPYQFLPPFEGILYVDTNVGRSTDDIIRGIELWEKWIPEINKIQRYYITPIPLDPALYMRVYRSVHYGVPVDTDYNEHKEKTEKQLYNLIDIHKKTGDMLTGLEKIKIKPFTSQKIINTVPYKRIRSFDMELQNEEQTITICKEWTIQKEDEEEDQDISCASFEDIQILPNTPLPEGSYISLQNVVMEYKLAGKNIRYILKVQEDTPSSSWWARWISALEAIKTDGVLKYFGVKIKWWAVQWYGEIEETTGREAFTKTTVSIQRNIVRKNILKNIKNISHNQIVNGIKYINGEWKNVKISAHVGFWVDFHTLVVQNGNLVIDKNIERKSHLNTIIVLQDSFNIVNNNTLGNIYITPNVTDIHTILYADGWVVSVNNDLKTIWLMIGSERRDILHNQIRIYGSLFTRNTLGWYSITSITDTLPWGKATFDSDLAINYDLNHLRGGNDGCIRIGWYCPDQSPVVIEYDPRIIQKMPKIFLAK